MKQAKTSGWDFLWYALYAFAGLGLEFVLIGIVEPLLFGNINANDYTTAQRIIHWIFTSLCWGITAWLLIKASKNKSGFNVLSCDTVKKTNIIFSTAAVAVCIILNFFDWKTLKIIGEFQSKEPIIFIFQYVYYIFEVILVFLIVAFGQKFAEDLLKKKSSIPFGGIVLCCTWGTVHILSKGSIYTGIGIMVFALIYGIIYILLNRNAKLSYIAMLLAFII